MSSTEPYDESRSLSFSCVITNVFSSSSKIKDYLLSSLPREVYLLTVQGIKLAKDLNDWDTFGSLSGIVLQFPVSSVSLPLTLSLVKAHNCITVLNRCHKVMYTVQYQGDSIACSAKCQGRFSASAFNVHTHHVRRSWQDKRECTSSKATLAAMDLITKAKQLMSISGSCLQPMIHCLTTSWTYGGTCMRQICHFDVAKNNNNHNWRLQNEGD